MLQIFGGKTLWRWQNKSQTTVKRAKMEMYLTRFRCGVFWVFDLVLKMLAVVSLFQFLFLYSWLLINVKIGFIPRSLLKEK